MQHVHACACMCLHVCYFMFTALLTVLMQNNIGLTFRVKFFNLTNYDIMGRGGGNNIHSSTCSFCHWRVLAEKFLAYAASALCCACIYLLWAWY